ncbi:YidH family protein [Actinokineospora sp. G85]|uniref:YidH family protein n=1 Tax=Actinokineospora sp. G85 TaxID=3406626 RepID=UPI003C784ABE
MGKLVDRLRVTEGEEPDYRFSLANERTFLSWVRTSLALLAGGVAVSQYVPQAPVWLRLSISLVLVVLGATLAVLSHRRWRSTELAMRLGRPLPPTTQLPLLTVGLTVVALGTLALVLVATR